MTKKKIAATLWLILFGGGICLVLPSVGIASGENWAWWSWFIWPGSLGLMALLIWVTLLAMEAIDND